MSTRMLTQKLSRSDGVFESCLAPETEFSIKVSKQGYFTNCVRINTAGFPANEIIVGSLELERIIVDEGIEVKNIYYDFNKSDIRPDAAVELNKLVSRLRSNPTIKIELGSHTDSRGNDEYNKKLSQRRAEAAVKYIVRKGIDQGRVTARGYGESALKIAVASTEEDHQANRRTEFKVTGFLKTETIDLEALDVPLEVTEFSGQDSFDDCPELEIR